PAAGVPAPERRRTLASRAPRPPARDRDRRRGGARERRPRRPPRADGPRRLCPCRRLSICRLPTAAGTDHGLRRCRRRPGRSPFRSARGLAVAHDEHIQAATPPGPARAARRAVARRRPCGLGRGRRIRERRHLTAEISLFYFADATSADTADTYRPSGAPDERPLGLRVDGRERVVADA